jgi:hypothetical protein
MVDGLDAIDRRSGPARLLLEWRRDLVADLGGEDPITAQQRALVEVITRTRLYVDHLDAYLMQQRSLINRKTKTALPVLLQRQALADSLARHMSLVGLERRTKPVPSLDEYLSQHYGAAQPEAPEGTTLGVEGEK